MITPNFNKFWLKKEDHLCLVAHIALVKKDTNQGTYHLDNACSRHMSKDKSLFKHINNRRGGNLIFEDGSRSRVKGKDIVEIPGLPLLHDVLYVEVLKVIFRSINQIFDDDLVV